VVKHTLAVDAALLGTVLIWAVNFTVVKLVLEDLDPFAFNTVRLIGASVIFLVLARFVPGPRILAEDRLRFIGLALVGHLGYQLLFISGIDETTASNSAILLGLTPVFVAILSASFTAERISSGVWVGIAVSVAGVYLVLHDSARLGGSSRGDWLTLAATLCWSAYTVAGQPVVARYGLFKTNAYTMALGTLVFLPIGLPALWSVPFESVPALAWAGTAYSFVFALVVAYSCWYFAVGRIGPTQTAIYSNLMPVAALAIAHFWIGEPTGALQLVGAMTIVLGVYLVRRDRRRSLDPVDGSR
jgi:drug/metabolite transporter (DMT)-like permease